MLTHPSEQLLQCAEKLSAAMPGQAAHFAADQALAMLRHQNSDLYLFWIEILRAILVVEETDEPPHLLH